MRFFSRLFSHTVIAFVDGSCVAIQGKVCSGVLRDLAGILVENGVPRAEIRIGGDGRIRFSKEIPPEVHQRLRNILVQI
jgi:hypothetical protein